MREAEPGWLFARDVFEERRNDGLLTLVENPHVSRGWDKYYRKYQSRRVVRARRKRQGKRDRGDDQLWVRLDQCRFGQRLRRPSRRGVKVRKRTRFLLSDEKLGRLMKQRPSGLNCACPPHPDGRHDHAMQPRGKGQDQTKRTKWVSGYTAQLCHWILECAEKRLGFHQGILAAGRDGKRCYEALVGENEDVELFGEGHAGDPEEDEDDDMTADPASEMPNRYCAPTDASAAGSRTSVRWNGRTPTRPRPQAETDAVAQPVLPSKPWPGRGRDGQALP